MNLNMKFEESNQRINIPFSEVHQASDGGFERGYEEGYSKGNKEGYAEGYSEAQEEVAPKFGIQNEVTGTGIVTCDYVNENEHEVEVQLSSDTITDFSNKQVKVCGKNLFKLAGREIDNNNGVWSGNTDKRNFTGNKVFIGLSASNYFSHTNINSYEITDTNVVINSKSDAYGLSFDFKVKEGESYNLSAIGEYRVNGAFFDKDGYLMGSPFPITTSFTITNGVEWMIISLCANKPNEDIIISDIQLELCKYKTEYEPYTEKTYTPNADGTLNVTSFAPTMNIICDGVDISAKYYCCPSVEYDRFWDEYQDYGNRTNYNYGYSGHGWNDNTFEPKYDISPVNASGIFSASRITDIKGILERKGKNVIFDNCTDLTYLMNGCISTTFPDINVSKASNINQLLYGAKELLSIRIYGIKESQTMSSSFVLCNKLVDLQLEGVIGKSVSFANSNLLSDASIQNIIDCLADLTGQSTQTVTFHSNIKINLTDEQLMQITSKNWKLG